MKHRKLLLIQALFLLVSSPLALADEMGTGRSTDGTNTSAAQQMQQENAERGKDREDCALWQLLLDWFK